MWRFPLCFGVTIGMQRTGTLPDKIGDVCNGNGRRRAIGPSSFSRMLEAAAVRRLRENAMIGFVRVVSVVCVLAFGLNAAQAADKAYKRDDLADAAIKLQEQIKTEAGSVAKPASQLRTDADVAIRKGNLRESLQILGQLAAVAPEDGGNWLRLAKTILQVRPITNSEQTLLRERASTASYLAYLRAGNAGEEADALAVLGRTFADRKLWRPALDTMRLSLDLREVADVRGAYEKLRDDHGFRLLDYSVDLHSHHPASASSSPKTSPSAPTLRRISRWLATMRQPFPPRNGNSASTA